MAELKNIRIAISGIYDYAFEELGNLGLSFSNAPDFTEKKAIYKVYRPATVLASAVDKFKMLPLTHHHPRNPVDEKNFRELTIGFTDSNPFVDYLEDKNEVGIRSTALLYDSEALDAYERGEIQLSPGYFADFEWQNGVSPNGEKYDIIMKEIKDVNHLALLPNGRGGNDAVVLDSRKTIFDIVREQMQKRKELNLLVPNSSTQEGTPLPATVSKNNLSQDSLPRKTIFEIVQMNIFDQIRYGAI